MESSGKKTLGQAIDQIIGAVEGLDAPARATAIRAACEHLDLIGLVLAAADSNGTGTNQHQIGAATNAQMGGVAPASGVHDIRTYKDEKAPANAIEMACVVTHYLGHLASPPDRKTEVGAADLEKYFKQGGYPLPKRMAQLLVDARGAGYFDKAGHGKYKLNPVGHNLVVHKLPKRSK
jgi:hypothetical protein